MIDLFLQDVSDGSSLPWRIVAMRMCGALLLSGLIGLERELDQKAAGLRTHMLTGVAACLYGLMTLSLLTLAEDGASRLRIDPVRVVEAVTAGVAFLAAGLIVVTRGRVKGLTTGAGMWLAGAIGLACGLGFWILAGFAAALAFLVIAALKSVERAIGTSKTAETDQARPVDRERPT